MSAGTKLGAYDIVAPIGAGGMGEVYRARDTKLNRDVALKILPDAFAGDPARLAPANGPGSPSDGGLHDPRAIASRDLSTADESAGEKEV